MAYDPAKDRFKFRTTESTLGGSGAPITPSDTVDMTVYPKAIVVTAAGNLKILPVGNDDAVTVTFTSAPVGFIPPYRVRRVFNTGTSASVATIGD